MGPRAKHCSVKLDDNNVLVFGGQTHPESLSTTAQIYSIDNYKWRKVTGQFPCGENVPKDHFTTCGLLRQRNINGTDDYSVIVPTRDHFNASCTAILHWPSLRWDKVENDYRKYPIGGQVIT